MRDPRLDSAHLFPSGRPVAPVKTTLPKYIGDNGLRLSEKKSEILVDSVRPERIMSVSEATNH